jgi:hypothetical protein
MEFRIRSIKEKLFIDKSVIVEVNWTCQYGQKELIGMLPLCPYSALQKENDPRLGTVSQNDGVLNEVAVINYLQDMYKTPASIIALEKEQDIMAGRYSTEKTPNHFKTAYTEQVQELVGSVTYEEQLTWGIQEREARAYLADINTPTPFIDGIIAGRGIPKQVLVDKIIKKSDDFNNAAGNLLGAFQKEMDVWKANRGKE